LSTPRIKSEKLKADGDFGSSGKNRIKWEVFVRKTDLWEGRLGLKMVQNACFEMTLRYAHLSPEHKKRALDVLGKRMKIFIHAVSP